MIGRELTNIQHGEIKIIIQQYKTNSNNSNLTKYIQNNQSIHGKLSKSPDASEILIAIHPQKDKKAMGYDNIPAGIPKRHKFLFSHII